MKQTEPTIPGDFTNTTLASLQLPQPTGYALKIVTIHDPAMRAVAVREVEVLKCVTEIIRHPNLVTIKKVYQSADKLLIAMPLCSGGELYERVASLRRFTERTAAGVAYRYAEIKLNSTECLLAIMNEARPLGAFEWTGESTNRPTDQPTNQPTNQPISSVLSALRALHGANPPILHLDVKPENLLYLDPSERAELLVTDFGLARVLPSPPDDQQGHQQGQGQQGQCVAAAAPGTPAAGTPAAMRQRMVGTVGYMAPEIIASRHYSTAADLFSTGVVLYTLLVGYPPFPGRSDQEVLAATANGRYVPMDGPRVGRGWGDVSAEAKDVVRRLLECDVRTLNATTTLPPRYYCSSDSPRFDLIHPSIHPSINCPLIFRPLLLHLIISLPPSPPVCDHSPHSACRRRPRCRCRG